MSSPHVHPSARISGNPGARKTFRQGCRSLPCVAAGAFVGLTIEGERVLAWAQQTLASLSNMRADAAVAKSSMTGTLRLGAIPTTMAIAALLTAPCRAAFPNIRYTISSLSAESIISQLDRFELDLGLTYLDDPTIEGMEKLHLFNERYVLLANRKERLDPTLTWEEAARLPLFEPRHRLDCPQSTVACPHDGRVLEHRAGTRSASPRRPRARLIHAAYHPIRPND